MSLITTNCPDAKCLKSKNRDMALNHPEAKKAILDLAEEMRVEMEINGGCGIACPQLGYSRNMFITKIGDEITIYINPTIVFASESIYTQVEGCLSIPGYVFEVPRCKKIGIKYYDENLDLIFKEVTGLEAQIIQHEMCHLKGKILSDQKNMKVKEYLELLLSKEE